MHLGAWAVHNQRGLYFEERTVAEKATDISDNRSSLAKRSPA
jgi:hypothetical protein